MGNEARSSYLGVGFGHSATLEKSDGGAVVTIRGPRGVAPVVLDITVTEAGATVRVRDNVLCAPPASIGSVRPAPASVDDPFRVVDTPRNSAPVALPMPVAPVSTAASLEPRLSLQQYASLRAACVSVSYEKLTEVRARYSLDEAGDAAEADAWARKFAQDTTLFESYRRCFQMFRSTASPGVSTMSSSPSSKPSSSKPPSSPPSTTTQGMPRVLTLGQHATMTAELLHRSSESVYAAYGLSDSKEREEVLRACEDRLRDPQMLQTWKQLYTMAVQSVEAARK